MITIQFIIRGKVQQVAYRYFVKQSADKLGIKGWAKNQIDGTVKVLAQAEEGPLSLFEAYLHKGSTRSNVEEIEIIKEDTIQLYKEFKILNTNSV